MSADLSQEIARVRELLLQAVDAESPVGVREWSEALAALIRAEEGTR
jgi:hypothetical protein